MVASFTGRTLEEEWVWGWKDGEENEGIRRLDF